MLSNIEKCQLLAIVAHRGQQDKSGTPYIKHLAWVAEHVDTEKEKCVAWLHDVVEDTDFTIAEIECFGLSDDVVEAVKAITKKESEEYSDYIKRVKSNNLARSVKLQDLRHNMNLWRLGHPPNEVDLRRHEKYKTAFAILSVDGWCV